MYTILRNDICKTHEEYKRVYLMGAINKGCDEVNEKDPMLYVKIGLSQNPIERLPQVANSYNKFKEVKVCGATIPWIPTNFSLLGYSNPLPFAASVEAKAQKKLIDLYKDLDAIDVKLQGLKDWYRPTAVYTAAFCIFEAIKDCYKDSGNVNIPLIKWTIPTSFKDSGNSIISIKEDYLHYLNNFKKVKMDLTHFMYNSYPEDPEVEVIFLFNKWLKKNKNIDMDTRGMYLRTAHFYVNSVNKLPMVKNRHLVIENKAVREGYRIFAKEFLQDKAFLQECENTSYNFKMELYEN